VKKTRDHKTRDHKARHRASDFGMLLSFPSVTGFPVGVTANASSQNFGSQCRSLHDTFSYSPSALENEWFPPDYSKQQSPKAWATGKVCDWAEQHLRRPKSQGPHIDDWLQFSARGARRGSPLSIGTTGRQPSKREEAALSKITCSDGRVEFIEPLNGMARHPTSKVDCYDRDASGNVRVKHVAKWQFADPFTGLKQPTCYDLSYLVLQDGCRNPSGGRNLFYDVGSARYGSPINLEDLGSGSSIQLFSQMYAQNCIEFDRIWAWEIQKYDPDSYWRDVPAEIRAKLTFMNIGVPKEPDPNGVIALLKATAKPDDFVVLKVDCDASHIEESIINALLKDHKVSALVDELYFEHHFFGENWGIRPNVMQWMKGV
jgi:hypothetical protein